MNLRHLRISIILLVGIGLFAAVGLSLDGDWAKALRVVLAVAVYTPILLFFSRRQSFSVLPFVIAGGCAELASGWLRPDARGFVEPVMVAAAMLLGAVHWFGLSASQSLRERLRS